MKLQMKCPECQYSTDSETECPRCGTPMRQSYLTETQSNIIKVQKGSAPTVFTFLSRFLIGLVCVQMTAGLVTLLFLFTLAANSVDMTKLMHENRAVLALCKLVLLTGAVILATGLACNRAYLAQLIGAAIGFAGGTLLWCELSLLGIRPTMLEWGLAPVAGLLAGFLSGLRIHAPFVIREEFAYRPINAWEKDTKPAVYELPPPPMQRWNRLFAGLLGGLVCSPILRFFLRRIVGPMYGGNVGLVEAMLGRVDLPITAVSLLAAGMIAGSGTRHGLTQGLLCSFSLLGLHFITGVGFLRGTGDELVFRVILTLVMPVLGGVLGHKLLGPAKVYRNAETGPRSIAHTA